MIICQLTSANVETYIMVVKNNKNYRLLSAFTIRLTFTTV